MKGKMKSAMYGTLVLAVMGCGGGGGSDPTPKVTEGQSRLEAGLVWNGAPIVESYAEPAFVEVNTPEGLEIIHPDFVIKLTNGKHVYFEYKSPEDIKLRPSEFQDDLNFFVKAKEQWGWEFEYWYQDTTDLERFRVATQAFSDKNYTGQHP